jgi:hypothetical protein
MLTPDRFLVAKDLSGLRFIICGVFWMSACRCVLPFGARFAVPPGGLFFFVAA